MKSFGMSKIISAKLIPSMLLCPVCNRSFGSRFILTAGINRGTYTPARKPTPDAPCIHEMLNM